MAGGSNGYRAARVRRQLTPGLISSLPGTAGLPPCISFSTSYLEGGTTRDIPVPEPVMSYLHAYVRDVLPTMVAKVMPDTPLFWAKWGRPVVGRTVRPMTGKNLWRLTKFYG